MHSASDEQWVSCASPCQTHHHECITQAVNNDRLGESEEGRGWKDRWRNAGSEHAQHVGEHREMLQVLSPWWCKGKVHLSGNLWQCDPSRSQLSITCYTKMGEGREEWATSVSAAQLAHKNMSVLKRMLCTCLAHDLSAPWLYFHNLEAMHMPVVSFLDEEPDVGLCFSTPLILSFYQHHTYKCGGGHIGEDWEGMMAQLWKDLKVYTIFWI